MNYKKITFIVVCLFIAGQAFSVVIDTVSKVIENDRILSLNIITTLDSNSVISELIGSEEFFIVCHKIGRCGTGVLHYEEYFDLFLATDSLRFSVVFLFLGEDSLELRRFVNGYRTKFKKAGAIEDNFFVSINYNKPKYWPIVFFSLKDSIVAYEIPSPQIEEFIVIKKKLGLR